MPRTARVVIPDIAYHIVQRGNNRQDVFFVAADRRAYLDILCEQADRYGMSVLGYCLMGNHVHLVAIPRAAASLAKAVGRTHWLYAQHVNRLHGRSGHLWQNRFYSCALDERHAWEALRYVERNPVRAKLARRAWEYEWSSASAHVGAAETDPVADLEWWRKHADAREWREALGSKDRAEETRLLRTRTHTGRPLGSDRFIAKLETAIGRRLRPLPVGRPGGRGDAAVRVSERKK